MSNWLISKSPLNYDKKLKAVRGNGLAPSIHTFDNEWEEARWIAEDLIKRKKSGSSWNEHMILVRTNYSGRKLEASLLSKEIPYQFIGGTKLLESAHVKDVLSVLRILGNNQDEIGWMRYLTLWPGIGEVKAVKIISKILDLNNIQDSLKLLDNEGFGASEFTLIIKELSEVKGAVSQLISQAVNLMIQMLEKKYKNQDWDKRKRDYDFVEKLAVKHTSVLDFIEDYILNPIFVSQRKEIDDVDKVTLITIHSAKGTERDVCYISNVSPRSYPSSYAINNLDLIEEERRVLYVALTRAKNELIVTRNFRTTWARQDARSSEPQTEEEKEEEGKLEPVDRNNPDDSLIESYFFNGLPIQLVSEDVHTTETQQLRQALIERQLTIKFGIDIS
ncbi:superfamily I DNA/RNA helicase [Oligosphaera ethanolica]|uniref:Superfamily I DNA/RNA helicase n=1 Tax=Oligosphaera ethanolica TaxID=760260 RepID=A0AAE3VD00_9BACT|nr:superfamily I DNA/RNA helicase [Oligosphaera ethanolica]